jgi:hypothetical protein
MVESVLSQYCGWQSRAGVVRYLKFREPYTVGPAACCLADKTGMLVINKKSYAVQVDTVRSYYDFTECSQVGTHTHGGVILDCQVTQTVVDGVNEVSGMITTPESTMRIGLFHYAHWANQPRGLGGSWP